MKNKLYLIFIALVLLASRAMIAQGTLFTYQGRLNAGTNVANGTYDFQFKLYGNPAGSSASLPITSYTTNAVPVTGGLFTAAIDFGPGIYTGSNYWLEVSVRTNGSVVYTVLSPLQALTPVPYAVMAGSASNLLGSVSASQLTGTIPSAALPGTLNFSGTVTASTFSGNGSGLTNLMDASGATLAGLDTTTTLPWIYPDTNSITVTGAAVTNYNGTYVFQTVEADPGAFVSGEDDGLCNVYTNVANPLYMLGQVIAGRNPAMWFAYDPVNNGHDFHARNYNNFGWTDFYFAGFDNGPALVNAYPAQAYWTRLITNQVQGYVNPSAVINYPKVGQSQHAQQSPAFGYSAYAPLLYVPSGSGVVRSVKTVENYIVWTNRNRYSLRAYVDAGVISNLTNPPAANLIFNAKIQTLLGDKYRTNGIPGHGWSMVRSSRYINSLDNNTNNYWLLHLTLPMLFTNGIYICLYDDTNNTPISEGFNEVTYELGSLSYGFANWRLRTGVASGVFSNDTVVPFLNTQNQGVLLALFLSATSTANNWPEGLWQIGPSWSADAEDTFMNPYYWSFGETAPGYDFGTTTDTLPGVANIAATKIEAYRYWSSDAPCWLGPVTGLWPVKGRLTADILSIYYGP